jgi:nucleotide-binding universal stress UspA family protein
MPGGGEQHASERSGLFGAFHSLFSLPSSKDQHIMAPVSPYYSFNLREVTDQPAQVNLDEVLESILMDFRVTLRKHEVEFLSTRLETVPSDEERVHRFFRTSMGRVVQFSRRGQVEVIVEGMAREEGYDVIITASRGKSDKLLLVGRFRSPGNDSDSEEAASEAV